MIMKKIMAGVLAAASVLAVSATASAVEAPDKTKAISKPGETEYEAGVTLMGAELDVELPASMKAFLNPYGATVSVNEDTDASKIMNTKNSIVSWGYEIVNNTENFGIFVDVKDLKGKMTSKDGSLKDAAPTAGSKEAWIAMVGGKDAVTAIGASAANTAPAALSAAISKAATTDNTGKQTCLPVKADGSADSASKFVYCQAKDKDGANTMTKGVIAFVGILAKGTSTSAVEWTEDDEITLTYTLKISPAPAVAVASDFS